MSSSTIETNRFSSQRDFAKAHGHTHILIESCQRNLDSFFSTFESLRVTLLSVIDDYEKLLRDTNLESVLKSLKETVTWIFEPVKDSSLSLSSNARAAFSDLSEMITQRNRGLKDSVGQLPKKNNNPNEPPINGTDPHVRGYWKMSKQEINNQKARILQPCIEQLVDMLMVFFQEGLQRIYSQQDAPSEPSHPADPDSSQVTPVFTSLPPVLQVATANWYVASQTGADVRQHEVSLPLLSTSDGLTRGGGAAYASKQLMEYSEHLERSPFKRFQVIGGYQYNPSDMCRAMDRYVTEQELRELNRFYLQEAQRMEGEGQGDPCEMPEDTSYVIDGVDIAGREGRERVREEIERLCARVCGDVSLEKMSRIVNFITYEVCSEMPEKSAWISAVLLYGKAHLVDIAKYLADTERNKIKISRLHDRVGLKIEEVMKWEVLPSSVVENWNVTNKQHIAIIETGYKKDFEFKTAEDAIQVETVDVGLHSINSEFRILESGQEAAGDHTPLLPVQRHTHTHRTLSLPPSSGDCEEAGKLPGRHQALQHTLSMHFPDEPDRYGAYLRRESRPHHFSSSRSKTGSSESISSASTLKAGNHVVGEDDVRQQLFQGTAFQHLPWPREDAVLVQESAAERSDFFLDLFCKTNQDLNNSGPKETRRSGLSSAKDRTGRTHKRTMSTDFSQSLPSPPPEHHQSVNDLAVSPSLAHRQDEVGQDWINSLSSDNKCQSWPSLFGVLDLDSSLPKDSHGNQLKSKHHKPEEEFDGTHINSLFNTISLTEDSKEFHSSDSEIWPSKSIWGGEGLSLPKSTSFSSDSEPEKDSFPRPKEITRTKYKTVFSEGKHPKVKHSIPRPPPFSPANSPQPRPLYHQPSPPPPPPPHPQHWDPKCHTDPNMRNPHPPPPPLWNGAPWHEGAPPPPPMMPPMHPHGPHPGQWRPPPPGANMPPHPHQMPHPPPQGPPPHGLYHTPPPPHFPPPPRLHTTPSPLSVPPESPRVPPLPPHQGLHPPSSGPPLHPPTSNGPPHPPGGQPPPHPPSSPAPPLSNSPIPPNQPPPPQYHPYPPQMHPSMMDPSHLHNQPPARGPPPYFVQRMPHQPHPNFYPIPNSNW